VRYDRDGHLSAIECEPDATLRMGTPFQQSKHMTTPNRGAGQRNLVGILFLTKFRPET
jgi:hypothetical protein